MIVRRYVVKDMPEAVLSIRKDLGKDAVILSTKKVRVRKWLGLLWQTRLEVTAAVGGDIPLHHDTKRGRVQPTQAVPPQNEDEETDSLLELAVSGGRASMPHSRPDNESDFETSTESSSFQMNLASAFRAYQNSSVTEPVVQRENREPRSEADLADIVRELSSLKLAVSQIHTGIRDQGKSSSDAVERRVSSFLRKEGLEDGQIERWLTAAEAANANDERTSLMVVRDEIMRELGEHVRPQPIGKSSRIVAFVGPTGVGKTTTIAKIAALHVLAGQRRIGLLTTDTFRIAAVQQLQTYADILDVPMVVADDVTSVPSAISELSSQCDLILVDTAGRNFRNAQTVSDTRNLLLQVKPDETLLVIAATTKPEDADEVAALCSALSISKLLFTKLDETTSVGLVPRLMMRSKLPISYVTNGQNVPDDIDILSLDELLARWTGGDVDARSSSSASNANGDALFEY